MFQNEPPGTEPFPALSQYQPSPHPTPPPQSRTQTPHATDDPNLDTDLTAIHSHLSITNAHITHLETLASSLLSTQIHSIKHLLQDAHRGLERLEAQFAVVGEIKKEVWQTYRRLRDFEEKNRLGEEVTVADFKRDRTDLSGLTGLGLGFGSGELREAGFGPVGGGIGAGGGLSGLTSGVGSIRSGPGSVRRPRAGTIRVVPALQTPSVAGLNTEGMETEAGLESAETRDTETETPGAMGVETPGWESPGVMADSKNWKVESAPEIGTFPDTESNSESPMPNVEEHGSISPAAPEGYEDAVIAAPRIVPVSRRPISMPVGGYRAMPRHSRVRSADYRFEREPYLKDHPDEVGGPSNLDEHRYLAPLIDDESWPERDVGVPRLVPVSIPVRTHRMVTRHRSRMASVVEGSSPEKSSSPEKNGSPEKKANDGKKRESLANPKRLSFPLELKRSRKEVIGSIAGEEARGGLGINDPKRKREGSADGTLITQAIMTADSDPRICVPHLAYIKIHEVRDLKMWLTGHRYLRESKRISRTEKVLHLLTVLQVGCRFESAAVLFSRRPKEVLSACREVFEGLLEMHSETMLPNRKILDRYLYPHLWHIVHNYGVTQEERSGQVYLPWPKEDIRKVLITLNIYIGRYRCQGHFALDGDIMDWGRYIHVHPDEALFNVPRWIERLQTAPPVPPRAATRPRVTR